VLHELGHGLGFAGFGDGLNCDGTDTGLGYYGADPTSCYGPADSTPNIWDRYVVDAAGNGPATYPNRSALGSLYRSGTGLKWSGPNGVRAAGGVRPTLFAPSTWRPGSSYSHLDESTYPIGSGNSLMTPILADGESIPGPGPITLGMMQDTGWVLAAPPVAVEPCTIVVPRTVSINHFPQPIAAIRLPDCAASDMDYAVWNVRPGLVPISGFGFHRADSTATIAFNYSSSPGTYSVFPDSGWDSSGRDLSLNTTSMVIKYATWTYTASSRSGSAVYINGLVHQWASYGMTSPGGRQVYVQRYTGGAWQNIAVRTTNSTGSMTIGFVQTKVYQYRLVTKESTTAWSGTSASTFR
jgi:hypothetical protein